MKSASYWAKEIFNEYVVPKITIEECEDDYGYEYIPENGDLVYEVITGEVISSSEKYSIKQVEHHGGEDCGSEYWLVYKLTILETNETIFIKYSGDYSSWERTDNWEVSLVEPKEKTIIVYEEI